MTNIIIKNKQINELGSCDLESLLSLYSNRFQNLSQNLKLDSTEKIFNLSELEDNFTKKISIIIRINNIVQQLESYSINCEDFSKAKTLIFFKEKVSKGTLAKLKILIEGIVVKFIIENGILLDIIFPGDKSLLLKLDSTHLKTKSKVAIMSDIHIGSTLFREENFLDAINFIINDADIKYLILAGDVCDGVGIYPGHENNLLITDIEKQYVKAAEILNIIPKEKTVFFVPGNHDASPLFEPQKKLTERYSKYFNKNIIFTTNPTNIFLENRDFLVYHGASLDGIISSSEEFSYDDAGKVMEYLLRIKHLAPKLGRSAISSWYNIDHLIIKNMPWAFITGHIHTFTNYELSNGTKLFNAGTWQDLSDFQRRLGHKPIFCKLLICSLGDGFTEVKDFYA